MLRGHYLCSLSEENQNPNISDMSHGVVADLTARKLTFANTRVN
jgi:hypothetical protein